LNAIISEEEDDNDAEKVDDVEFYDDEVEEI